MFEKHFLRDKQPKKSAQETSVLAVLEPHSPGFVEFVTRFGGASYENGLYRILPASQMPTWTENVAQAFPDHAGQMLCFGFDWVGRSFALDFQRVTDDGHLLVSMFEPGTGEVMEIPVPFIEFHNEELVEFRNDALASEFFGEWKSAGGASPGFNECIGYIKPLFLGGDDAVDNLEPVDLDVYWSISAQLLARVRDLPDGAELGDIDID